MKILFAGTPDFAVAPLKNIIENGFEVVGVITQTDKPQGRKGILTPPPVKQLALEAELPLLQPEKIRDYMREFYVYGFKSRDEYDKKSARSYDNERRRIESYLGEYMSFHQSDKGKNVFLSIDSRSVSHNPLYNALKAKSFTDGDITLHFIIFDILHSPEIALTLNEITDAIDVFRQMIRAKMLLFND